MIRHAAKEVAGWFLRHVYFRVFPLNGACVVLMFHRVLDANEISPWNHDLAISTGRFTDILRALKGQFACVDLYEWLRHPHHDRPSFAVTFDDGWRDNFTHALPILKAQQVRATVFVTAGMVGTTQQFWFERVGTIIRNGDHRLTRKYFRDALQVTELPDSPIPLFRAVVQRLKQLPLPRIESLLGEAERQLQIATPDDRVVMDWPELAVMSRAGVTIGSHGVNHAILVPLDETQRRFELEESARLLSSHDVGYVPLIAFPNGDYDDAAVAMSRASGYRAMVTASSEAPHSACGVLVPRIPVSEKISVNALFTRIMMARVRSSLLSAQQLVALGGVS
jgi:peptidoglycan/xylan/chitin deacetylase (PgdA/CDA1 family)